MSSKGILSESLINWAVGTAPRKQRTILNEAWMQPEDEACESSECEATSSDTSSTRALQDSDEIEIVDEADEGDPEAELLAAEEALAQAIVDGAWIKQGGAPSEVEQRAEDLIAAAESVEPGEVESNRLFAEKLMDWVRTNDPADDVVDSLRAYSDPGLDALADKIERMR